MLYECRVTFNRITLRRNEINGWNDKLIFEVREGSKIVGFRIYPAAFKEPSEQEWTEVKLG